MNRCNFLAVSLILMCIGAAASGAVAIGGRPELRFRAPNGRAFDLQQLRGRLVLVHFWSARSEQSTPTLAKLVELNGQYGRSGVSFIGVFTGTRLRAFRQLVSQREITWAQSAGPSAQQIAQRWGVSDPPAAFLLSPDGVVLWIGQPGSAGPQIDKAMFDHPPRLVDEQVMATVNKALTDAQQMIRDFDQLGAIQLLGTIPAEAAQDRMIGLRLEGIQRSLQQYGEVLLSEVPEMVKAGKYVDAANQLRDVAAGLSMTSVGPRAQAQLDQLLRNPAAKNAIATADAASGRTTQPTTRVASGSSPQEDLAMARQLAQDGDDRAAYLKYQQVVNDYPRTPEAAEALKAVRGYDQQAREADALLQVARSYGNAGRIEEARAKYQQLIKEHPDTAAAKTAAEDLKALPQEEAEEPTQD